MRTALFTLSLVAVSPLMAQDFACPSATQTAGSEWQAYPNTITPPASGEQAERVELYADHPRLGGAPIADDSSEQIGVAPVTWTLAGQPLFMACIYTGSPQRLIRALPPGLSHCRANNEFEDQHLQLECR